MVDSTRLNDRNSQIICREKKKRQELGMNVPFGQANRGSPSSIKEEGKHIQKKFLHMLNTSYFLQGASIH